MRRHYFACALSLAACVEPPATSSSSDDVLSGNGRSLNGTSLNGRSLNGRSLNGRSLNGVSLGGITITGSQLSSAAPGTLLTGLVSDGGTVTLRIDSVSTLPAPNDDVWVYSVSYTPDGSTWTPLCTNGAIAFAGTWNYGSGTPGGGSWSADPSTFTLGCRGTALAKCAELGYKPWTSDSLRDHHEACTRMLRADYCGDGTPHTFDGWQLDVFDDLAIQTPTPGLTGFTFEAHWDADGAPCMSSYRALDLIESGVVPACVSARLSGSCTDSGFGDGSLLQNYFDPWSISVALQDAYNTYPLSQGELGQAITLVGQAKQLLAATPPRPRDAGQAIEQAVTHIKSALTKDLPAPFGNELMRRYALLVRGLVTTALAGPATTAQTTCANNNLAIGDTALAKPDYVKATNGYKNGVGCFPQ